MRSQIFAIGISSPSGGGKTAVTLKVSQIMENAVTILWDDYDFDTTHPQSLTEWLKAGANNNDWKTPLLRDDLRKLKAGESILSPVTGKTIRPKKYVIFDSPLGYTHTETAAFIDYMIFIDTPLDVAMARRMLRNLDMNPSDSAISDLKMGATAYLEYGRQAFLEMDKQVKPTCDLILDGCLLVDDLAKEIIVAVKSKFP